MILKVWESNGSSSGGTNGNEGEAEIGMWQKAKNAVKRCLKYQGDDGDEALSEVPPGLSLGLGWVIPGQAAKS